MATAGPATPTPPGAPPSKSSEGLVFLVALILLLLYFSRLLALDTAIIYSHGLRYPLEWFRPLAGWVADKQLDFEDLLKLFNGLAAAGGFAYLRRVKGQGRAGLYGNLLLALVVVATGLTLASHLLVSVRKEILIENYSEATFVALANWLVHAFRESLALMGTLLGVRLQEAV